METSIFWLPKSGLGAFQGVEEHVEEVFNGPAQEAWIL